LSSDESTPVAITIAALPDSIVVGETLAVQVAVLNRSGDTIPGAPVELITLTPDTLGIHPTQIAIIGKAIGPGRFIARSGNFPSAALQIPVK